MILVESHILKATEELDIQAIKAKNLYNKANYVIRQEFIHNHRYISKFEMFTLMKSHDEYKAFPARVARGVLRTLDANWLSFFSCIKKWKENRSLFKGKPNLPKYLPKSGKFTSIYSDAAVLTRHIDKGLIGLSKLKLQIPYQNKDSKIIEIQIIPLKTKKYKINICYDYKEKILKANNNKYCSIDLGINNLMTITSNSGINPLIVNGRPLKSINQYYNKKKAEYQSKLPSKQFTSNRINTLTEKRGNKINDYLHKASNHVINHCLDNDLNTLIVGYNEFWKHNVNLGSKTNQSFVSIPFSKLIHMLEYKCLKNGLNLIKTEESYTSKCSFLDLEDVKKHDTFKGKRIKRGMFISERGRLINSDVNGSYNILRKVVPNAFSNGIEGVAVHPGLISL